MSKIFKQNGAQNRMKEGETIRALYPGTTEPSMTTYKIRYNSIWVCYNYGKLNRYCKISEWWPYFSSNEQFIKDGD